jgi:hypothetical protein
MTVIELSHLFWGEVQQLNLRTNVNPTASLYSALSLTPLSVRKIRTVIALLHPGNQREDVFNRIRAPG